MDKTSYAYESKNIQFYHNPHLSPDQIAIQYPDETKQNYTLEVTPFLNHEYVSQTGGENPQKTYNSFCIPANCYDTLADFIHCSALKEYVMRYHFGTILNSQTFQNIDTVLQNIKNKKNIYIDLEQLQIYINVCLFIKYLYNNNLYNQNIFEITQLELFLNRLFHAYYLPLVTGTLSIEKESLSFTDIINEKPNKNIPWYITNEAQKIIIEIDPTEVYKYTNQSTHEGWKKFLENNIEYIFNSETFAIIPHYLAYIEKDTQKQIEKNNSFLFSALSYFKFNKTDETVLVKLNQNQEIQNNKKVLHIYALVHFLMMYEKTNYFNNQTINVKNLVNYKILSENVLKIAENILTE